MEKRAKKLLLIDAAVILIISFLISFYCYNLLLMTVSVPILIGIRMLWVWWLTKERKGLIIQELIFCTVCVLFSALPDWISVNIKHIYDYIVPHYFEVSTIPIWMWLYWGMAFRFIARVINWKFLNPDKGVFNTIRIINYNVNSAWLKIIIMVCLVVFTKICIASYYNHPLWSWLPFAISLVIYLLLTKATKHDFKLLLIVMIVGPLIEIVYINVGHFYRYHQGIVMGVPAWIILWWMFGILLWKDIISRIYQLYGRNLDSLEQISRKL